MSTHGCTGIPCTICNSWPNHWYQPLPLQQQCTCYWHDGYTQGYCPIHNPGYTTPWITITTAGANPTPGLSPEDIEKIAQRVAQLLKGG